MPSRATTLGDWNKNGLVDEIGGKKAAASVGPPSTISRVMPRSARSLSTPKSSGPPALRRPQHLDAHRQQLELGSVRAALHSGNHPYRLLRAVRTSRESTRQAQHAVEHDAHRRVFRHAGQPAGQQRIVGQRGADADHDRVALGPQEMDAVARGSRR